MQKIHLTRCSFLAAMAVSLLPWCANTAGAAPVDKPNVIIILADDIGYGDLGCYGAKLIKTPNLDRLASQGMRFTDVHVAEARCTASRYALLTGRYHWRDGVPGISGPMAPLWIKRDRSNLASVFKASGYSTGIVGKWHLGFGEKEPNYAGDLTPGPLEVGFDEFFGYPVTNMHAPHVYIHDRQVVNPDPSDPVVAVAKKNGSGKFPSGGKAAQWVPTEMGDLLTGKAVDFIERHKEGPFFLYFASHLPHNPLIPNPRNKGGSQAGLRGDCVQEFDDEVGKIMATLDRLGLREKTLVIVTSDNGGKIEDAGKGTDPGAVASGHQPNAPWRGEKYSLYEGGHRMPFILSWPGHVPANKVSNELFGLVDMTASMAVLLGQTPPPEAVDSVNVLSALMAEKLGKPVRDWLIFGNEPQSLSLRKGPWKYIEPKTKEGGKEGMLINLADDPGETTDLSARYPKVREEMQAILDKERARTPIIPRQNYGA